MRITTIDSMTGNDANDIQNEPCDIEGDDSHESKVYFESESTGRIICS